MTPDDRAMLESLAAQCERMGIDDLRTVPVDDPWALARAIRAALAAVPPPAETGQREALGKAIAYVETALRSGGVKAVVNENAYERGHRSGLQHALNAMKAELAALASPTAPERTEALEQRIAELEAAHVSREDREAAIQAAVSAAVLQSNIAVVEMRVAEARRLLKLEDA